MYRFVLLPVHGPGVPSNLSHSSMVKLRCPSKLRSG